MIKTQKIILFLSTVSMLSLTSAGILSIVSQSNQNSRHITIIEENSNSITNKSTSSTQSFSSKNVKKTKSGRYGVAEEAAGNRIAQEIRNSNSSANKITFNRAYNSSSSTNDKNSGSANNKKNLVFSGGSSSLSPTVMMSKSSPSAVSEARIATVSTLYADNISLGSNGGSEKIMQNGGVYGGDPGTDPVGPPLPLNGNELYIFSFLISLYITYKAIKNRPKLKKQ